MYLPPLKLRRGDRAVLEAWCRAGTVEARVARRARIALLAAEGRSNREIAELVDLHYNQVGIWRKRYAEYGLAGLDDLDRSGRPCVYDHDDVLLLVKTVTEPPPDQATRWSMEALSQVMADHGVPISASQCWRICRALDLKPWQVRSWMTSHDPDFWEKAADVCALYLDPPTNAVVFSVDEKTGMQAKARINPTRPAVPGLTERREFEYERNGTAVLYAALNVHQGDVFGWVTDTSDSINFITFLWDLMDRTPPELDLHVIVDNLSAHTTEKTDILLATTLGSICISPPPTRRGSTRWNCSSPSWSVACYDGASSARSTTWPDESSPSSTTTTAEPNPSAGPTTADHSKSRNSQ
jgi:transposase